jgi:hypothetical protein
MRSGSSRLVSRWDPTSGLWRGPVGSPGRGAGGQVLPRTAGRSGTGHALGSGLALSPLLIVPPRPLFTFQLTGTGARI